MRFALCVAIAALASGLSSVQAQKLPVESFGNLPAIVDADISPSGDKVALVVNETSGQRVIVLDTKTRSVLGGANAPQAKANDYRGRYVLGSVTWFSDDRFLVQARSLGTWRGTGTIQDCGLLSVSADGRESVLMMNFFRGMELRGRTCGPLSLKGPEPDTILMVAYSQAGHHTGARARSSIDVYAVNVKTGKSRLVEAGNLDTGGFRAAPDGKIRLRFDGDSKQSTMFARLSGSDEWKPVFTGRIRNYDEADEEEGGQRQGLRAQYVAFGNFGADPDRIYAFLSGKGTEHIAPFNLRTGQFEAPVLQDPKFDVGGLVGLRSGKAIGARIAREYPETVYFLDDWKQLKNAIRESFPGDRVSVISSNDDLSKHILYLEGPEAPSGEYLFLDLKTSEAKNIGYPYPTIKPVNVNEAKWVTFKARDGVDIPAYVTMPPGSTPNAKGLPAIVMPHGGPRSRDGGDFDWFSQALANAGYVVLQPQFRGSAGFGFEWDEAGAKQWGRLMQNDVTDGLKYLVDRGTVDPKRVCILGWSYGGYAAGAGATLTPELYRCVVAGAGVFDLMEMLRNTSAYWRYYIGDPDKDRAAVEAVSPVLHVDKVRAPILLIHGRLDTTVPFDQSERFRDALKKAGKEVEFVELKAEDHYMTFAETRIQALKAMRDFLAKHNPP